MGPGWLSQPRSGFLPQEPQQDASQALRLLLRPKPSPCPRASRSSEAETFRSEPPGRAALGALGSSLQNWLTSFDDGQARGACLPPCGPGVLAQRGWLQSSNLAALCRPEGDSGKRAREHLAAARRSVDEEAWPHSWTQRRREESSTPSSVPERVEFHLDPVLSNFGSHVGSSGQIKPEVRNQGQGRSL